MTTHLISRKGVKPISEWTAIRRDLAVPTTTLAETEINIPVDVTQGRTIEIGRIICLTSLELLATPSALPGADDAAVSQQRVFVSLATQQGETAIPVAYEATGGAFYSLIESASNAQASAPADAGAALGRSYSLLGHPRVYHPNPLLLVATETLSAYAQKFNTVSDDDAASTYRMEILYRIVSIPTLVATAINQSGNQYV